MLLIAIILISIPALTYYVSSTLFHRSSKTVASRRSPPTIPYLLPGVFHAFNLAYDGPPKCFATLLKYYGDAAPFTVRIGLRPFVVFRDPKHVRKIAEAKQVQSQIIEHRITDDLIGFPKAISNGAIDEKAFKVIESTRTTLTEKYFNASVLPTMTDLYVSILSRNLKDKMFQVGSWTQIEDSWSFFQQVFTRCTVEMIFGSAIFKQYPRLIKDYWAFEDAVDTHIAGIPRFLIPNTHEGPRERLRQGIGQWLKTNHSGSEFAKIGIDDPDWDEYKGSKFIQERDDVLVRNSLDLEARTAEMLKILHDAMVEIVPSAIWSIIELTRNPDLAGHVANQVTQQSSSAKTAYRVDEIVSIPIFQSLHEEIRRLRMARCVTYTNDKQEIVLDEHWTLCKGYTAIFFSQDVALNTEAWEKARPQTTKEPLNDFWAQRFLVPDTPSSKARGKQQSKEVFGKGDFSMEGLEILAPVFGDEQHFALGIDYAKSIQAATVSVLLNEFDIQLCDPDATNEAIPTEREVAFGAVRPLDRVAVRIKKRKHD